MAPIVRAEKVHEDYLENLAKNNKFRVGFLLGMENIAGFQGIVVHMAAMQFSESDGKSHESISRADNEEILLLAINLTRMLPGGFTILGLFVVNPENVLEDEEQRKELTDTIKKIQEQFRQNPFLVAEQSDEKNFLVLVYSPGRPNPCVCQYIHTGKPVELVFAPKGIVWRTVELYFNLEDEYALEQVGDTCNIEGNLQRILGKVSQQLENAYVFRAGAPCEETDTVEMLFKSNKDSMVQTQPLMICLKNEDKDIVEETLEVKDGTVRLSGSICCRVFVPKGTLLSEVVKFAKNDITRSLAARLQLYRDSLQEDKVTTENLIDLHSDTPRRVFFTVQPTGVQFSDYLFAGENDDTVRENVSKLMDIDLEPTDIFLMVEAADDIDDVADTDVQLKEDDQSTQSEKKTDWPEIFLKLLLLLVALIGAYFAINHSQSYH